MYFTTVVEVIMKSDSSSGANIKSSLLKLEASDLPEANSDKVPWL